MRAGARATHGNREAASAACERERRPVVGVVAGEEQQRIAHACRAPRGERGALVGPAARADLEPARQSRHRERAGVRPQPAAHAREDPRSRRPGERAEVHLDDRTFVLEPRGRVRFAPRTQCFAQARLPPCEGGHAGHAPRVRARHVGAARAEAGHAANAHELYEVAAAPAGDHGDAHTRRTGEPRERVARRGGEPRTARPAREGRERAVEVERDGERAGVSQTALERIEAREQVRGSQIASADGSWLVPGYARTLVRPSPEVKRRERERVIVRNARSIARARPARAV